MSQSHEKSLQVKPAEHIAYTQNPTSMGIGYMLANEAVMQLVEGLSKMNGRLQIFTEVLDLEIELFKRYSALIEKVGEHSVAEREIENLAMHRYKFELHHQYIKIIYPEFKSAIDRAALDIGDENMHSHVISSLKRAKETLFSSIENVAELVEEGLKDKEIADGWRNSMKPFNCFAEKQLSETISYVEARCSR